MNFYRRARNFIRNHFIEPLLDFCAPYPALYEFVFYNLNHRTRREDLGDVFFMYVSGCEDFIQLKREKDCALKIPLDFPASPVKFKVAAVVHIFYPELAAEMKTLLLNIPCAVDVYISTTSPEKKSAIEKVFADFGKGQVTIKIFPNRGRDVAAAFVGFKDIYKDYDICVHIHGKKSPHAENRLAGWRDHLYKNLLGSPEIVGGILKILANEKVGAVFPQYFNPIRVFINWGENYLLTKNFLRGLGIEIDNRHLIEFPAGSMFWFKPKALAPLFESDLNFDDFPDELGQLDGTIAHAIERAFLFIVESTGFIWVKVDGDGLKSFTESELDENILRAWHSVLKRY
jgi:lipopolysaccharide biosynthesis protein